jgi:hypothetical protein
MFALVTPSYAPDFERCRLLVASVTRMVAANTHHYLLISRHDADVFAPLASNRVTIKIVEDMIPPWIRRPPDRTGVWLSDRTPPITGWVMQQLQKMSVFNSIPEDIAVFCDSDNAFIRAFNPAHRLMNEGRLLLFRVAEQYEQLVLWRDAAVELLGIPDRNLPVINYVGNLIAWRRDHLAAMHRRIEQVTGTSWFEAICRYPMVSEYVLYGIFIEHVLGIRNSCHEFFSGKLVKPSWNINLGTPEAMQEFFADMDDEYVGVMIHSRDGLPPATYTPHIKRFWTAPP